VLTITISKRAALLIAVAVLVAVPGAAVASHVFTDVVDGSTHAEGIEWLAGTGVTAGCGDGAFCPDEYVTRAQMATFMCRLSGNCGVPPSVDAASVGGIDVHDLVKVGDPVGDADTLDGLDSTEFLAAGAVIDADTLDGLDSTEFLAADDPIDADTLDGLDSSDFLGATGQAVDADSVDGIDSAGLMQHGPVEIGSNVWQVDGDSGMVLRFLAMPIIQGDAPGWAFNSPSLPATINGVPYSLDYVRVCFDAADTTGVSEFGLFIEGPDGPIDLELFDATGWYEPSCVDLSHPAPVRLDGNRSVMVRMTADVDDGSVVSIWSTTWTIVPTEAGHL
jgi:hypothetical protein